MKLQITYRVLNFPDFTVVGKELRNSGIQTYRNPVNA
jgi:ABC-type uncharacterized transport system permease subunit